ncbi:primosomal protein DnaI [Paenibacillus sp. J31TS4]|uniref:primosomal protein DnaI n=1 Tax=Paenibacillus sp. J31TS4 TaxID=2807195 RepID=UPI001AFE48F2|nr:primosomal protein DnaI [Paenibacillus sp. J31TS4]GIP40715.1 primosomal protein DnaI [Paenibacillus sp. J31TS4]
MESLGDLLKQLSDNPLLRNREERLRELAVHPLAVQWRRQYPFIREEDLKLNANKLYQFVTEQSRCAACPGLDNCPNDLQGHYTELSAEQVNDRTHIYDRKTACGKYTAYESQRQVSARIRSFYVDERSLNEGYSADDIFSIDLERAEAVDKLLDYIVLTKEQGLQKRGLYLMGDFGTGKTFLMGYLLHELAKAGHTGVIVYMPDFAEDLKAMFQEPHKLKETIDLLKETDLLVFDDIGAENMNPWLRDHVMGSILNYRMNRKPTFFTSNHDLNDLEKHFSFTNRDGDDEFKGQRIMDRIRPFVDVILVTGRNKRGDAR